MGLFIDAKGTTKNSFGIKDTDSSHFLYLVPGSDFTADRNLTITIGDAARTVTLSGDPTLGDWFDQSVKAAASPNFANLTLYNAGSGVLNFQDSTTAPASGDLTGQISSIIRTAESASIRFYIDGANAANDVPGRISFWTTPDGSATPAERMRITNAGYVGIGTVAPGVRLEVRQDANGQVELLKLTSVASTWTAGYGPYLSFYGGGDGRALASITGALQTTDNGAWGYLGFYTRLSDAGGLTEKMRIAANGNVGIGCSPGAYLLDVASLTGTGSIAAVSLLVRHIDGKASGAVTGDILYLQYSTAGCGVNIGDSGTDHPLTVYGLINTYGNLVMYAQDIIRGNNGSALVINGGNASGTGAHVILFGGAHSSLASIAYFRAASFRSENVAGTAAWFNHTGAGGHFYVGTGNCYVTAGHFGVPNGYSVYNAAWPGSATGTPIITQSGYLYYLTSSERFKINIERNWTSPLLDDFLKINPIRYECKPRPDDDTDKDKKAPDAKDKVNPHAIGFSAEECHASGVPGLINYDDELLPFSLREHGFLVYHHLVLQDFEKRLKALEKK